MRYCLAAPKLLLSVLSLFAVLAATGMGASTSAVAQEYPWCANYTKGSTSCSFNTFAQCMADVSGIGGFCERNTWYHPAAPARPKARASSGSN